MLLTQVMARINGTAEERWTKLQIATKMLNLSLKQLTAAYQAQAIDRYRFDVEISNIAEARDHYLDEAKGLATHVPTRMVCIAVVIGKPCNPILN